MILTSTLRKMGDKPVFKVSVPAHRVQAGSIQRDCPAYEEYFVKRDAAVTAGTLMLAFAIDDVHAQVVEVPASEALRAFWG